MAEITAAMVKQLRDKTGAGMMECKAALSEANGNLEEAVTLLRKRGLAQAGKRAARASADVAVTGDRRRECDGGRPVAGASPPVPHPARVTVQLHSYGGMPGSDYAELT